MNIKNNKVYDFNLGNLSFGELSSKVITEVMSDGRVSSHFLERHLPIWFPELEFVSGCRDHDHVNVKSGLKYDQKSFTKNGCRFMPSSMIGAGRKFNKDKFLEKADSLTYIICDVTSLPKVRVIFKEGNQLANQYPKGEIPFREKERFFVGVNSNETKEGENHG